MSTAQYTYVLNAPYQTSQDAMNRRSAHRPTHLDRINRMYAEGTLVFAGPTLSEDSNPAAPSTEWKPQGSLMIFRAESLEKVKEIVRDDLFWTEDVWDKEKIRINPIIPATPPL